MMTGKVGIFQSQDLVVSLVHVDTCDAINMVESHFQNKTRNSRIVNQASGSVSANQKLR